MSEIDRVLSENIRIMSQVITELCQRATRKQVCEYPLSRNQYYILRILKTSGAHLISDFARILDISPAAASKNIDRLVTIGFVNRRTRPEDRRGQEVHLLPAGRHIVEEFDRITAEKQADLMAELTEPEKLQLLDLMQRVVKHTMRYGHDMDLICLQCGGQCGEECIVKGTSGSCPQVSE